MALIVKPLSPALGAEIAGVDLSGELSAETIAAIIDTWHQHLVIVFRGQSLSEDEQIRFARHFGALQQRSRPPEARNEASKLKHPEMTMLVSNIRENGKLIGSLADGEMNFRSDFCYVEKPAKGTFLCTRGGCCSATSWQVTAHFEVVVAHSPRGRVGERLRRA
jgi:taurine dioxygenase